MPSGTGAVPDVTLWPLASHTHWTVSPGCDEDRVGTECGAGKGESLSDVDRRRRRVSGMEKKDDRKSQ